MTQNDIEELMTDERLIRNRRKIESVIHNANVIAQMDESISELVWSFCPKQINMDHTRAQSDESIKLSKKLKSLGLSFVGPTTMYAMMQSIGMVNDHHPECFLK